MREKPLVLVIEDRENLRFLTSKMVELLGYRSVVAEDGIEGLEKLAEYQPNIVLCDGQMPRMDGRGFVNTVFEDPKYVSLRKTPIIIYSGREKESFSDLQEKRRVVTVIEKPAIMTVIEKVLAKYMMHSEETKK